MIEHYRSYQASVVEDLPPGFTEFTKEQNTTNPTYPTFNDYFCYLVQEIDSALKKDDKIAYYTKLRLHQKALIKALGIFHKDAPCKDIPLKVWKFTDTVVVFDKFSWIPRYSEEFYEYRRPFFSCWEMSTALKMESNKAQLILSTKEDKILTKQLQLLPITEVNKPLVQDWTLPL